MAQVTESPNVIRYYNSSGFASCERWIVQNVTAFSQHWPTVKQYEGTDFMEVVLFKQDMLNFVARRDRATWFEYVISRKHIEMPTEEERRKATMQEALQLVCDNVEGKFDIIDSSPAWAVVRMIVRFPQRENGVLLKLALPDVYTMEKCS